ncbi:alpha/beta hydrolase [Saccharopolyspora sp. K220]|uniref:alpha/beta fold hydrolase n=1 Tax=Saccharopolyspora soli TaxID=2926618 RepID=UPI001F57D66A|nr:alpha/beta hydrolase [Saccharopolyspora soli]MCI2420592.1 alpha/beta hydrolase [Saccharopolyspora soli]
MGERRSGYIVTNDSVRLHYVTAGAGAPLVLVPGFSQSAAEFGAQIDDLGRDHLVVAVDHRGHGDSDKPPHGYRVSRLAADLRDLLEALDLRDVALLGHSLGCAVIWCYWDLFDRSRISRLVLVDQGPMAALDLAPAGQASELGAIFTTDAGLGIAAGLRGTDPIATTRSIVDMMHTPAMSEDEVEWIVEQNLLLPREHAATLHLDHYGNDWRDVLPHITVPTLVIGGEVSIFSPAVARWVAAQIPDAQLRTFSAAESGSHLLFRENAELFNTVVREFLSNG